MFDVVFRLVTLFTATILFYYYSLMLLLALLIVLECCHKELKRKKRREFHQIPSHLESLLCNMNDNAKTTIIPLRKQNETHQRMTSMTMDVMKFFLSSVLYHSCFIRNVASSLTQFNVLLTVFLTVQCCCCFFSFCTLTMCMCQAIVIFIVHSLFIFGVVVFYVSFVVVFTHNFVRK